MLDYYINTRHGILLGKARIPKSQKNAIKEVMVACISYQIL